MFYELYWLLVFLCIDYKILFLIFKCIYGLVLIYFSDFISIKLNLLYNFRFIGKFLLDYFKGKMFIILGVRLFLVVVLKFWNELFVEFC